MTQKQAYIDQQRRLLDPALGLSQKVTYVDADGTEYEDLDALVDPVSAEPVDDEEEQRLDRQSAVHLDPSQVPAYAVGQRLWIGERVYDVLGEQDADDPALVIRIIAGGDPGNKGTEAARID